MAARISRMPRSAWSGAGEDDMGAVTIHSGPHQQGSLAMPRPVTARSVGLTLGRLEPGRLNSIADIDGVAVGHSTNRTGDARTGVTVILPHRENVFRRKV